MAKRSIKAKTSGNVSSTKAKNITKTMPLKKAARAKTPSKSTTTFTLAAPGATEVFVAGCFNDWSPTANPLERDREGKWTCALLLEPGEHEYRFVVDNVWWDDPANLRRRQNEFGCENCIIIV